MPVYAGSAEGSAMMMEGHYADDLSSGSQGPIADFRNLMAELKSQNYDVIRFATYRTACKLRFLQKKTSLHLVDIWNIIEAFRENGLNSPEARMELSASRLETLLSSIFYQLNKRLPASQQIDLERCTSLLLNWFLATYDPDNNGLLVHNKFADFLKEAVALPCSVCESPTFGYIDSLPASIFDPHSKATVNDFLDTFMLDPSPPCLMWLSLLHRLANVENVLHPVLCDGCNRESFLGFRYKCQRCYSYQLCQDCFWRGRTSGNHSNTHEMKEYTSYKSPSKQLSHSLKKSFRCVPEKHPHQNIPRFPPEPEKRFNLSHIVPPSPIPSHNGFPEVTSHSYDMSSLDSRSLSKSFESSREDEHRLIARYAARLADTESTMRSPSDYSLSLDSSRQKDLISQLESKNREIMREIMRLRKQQEREDAALQSEQNPTLLAELRGLRQRKEELENHLSTLQESRRELMVQLEALMKLLKNHQASPRSTPNSSPRSGTSKSPPLSTPYPLSTSSRSAPTTPGSNPPTTDSLTGVGGDVRMAFGQSGSSRSLRNDLLVAADSVTNAMSSLVRELNSDSEDEDGGGDSKVFTSRDFETEDTESAVESLEGGGTLWREERQRAQEDRFMAEIQARNNLSATVTPPASVGNNGGGNITNTNGSVVTTTSSGASSNINNVTSTSSRGSLIEDPPDDDPEAERLIESGDDDDDDDPELYDNDPKDLDVFQRHASLTTDDESYVRTDDDEDGGNTDWEDSMRRWVNR